VLLNSPEFLFLFLPVVLFGYACLIRQSSNPPLVWLALASLFFYGWWNPRYVGLLLASVIFNYAVGVALSRMRQARRRATGLVLAFGISTDLLLLGYYKYANFFLDTAAGLGLAARYDALDIVLPLGISFFTFTQIAFLADVYQGKAREYNFIHYLLFVTYFPHLIAGPILHHSEMMPQFARRPDRLRSFNLAGGLTLFVIGLGKKVLIADSLAPSTGSVFDGAAQGYAVTFIEAWSGALAYTLQLYFDFSGYSDMALGLSLLFGIRLPMNFYSPYQATSIIEFWRRWHMTLSRFLRDYLYIPLGGTRLGRARRYLNLIVTMLLGGLWHGAGWTFVIWGGLHGAYLAINHFWRFLRGKVGMTRSTPVSRVLSLMLTFLAVCVAWVFFRASDLPTAMRILGGMAGLNGVVLPITWVAPLGGSAQYLSQFGVDFAPLLLPHAPQALMIIALLLCAVWLLPNSLECMRRARPSLNVEAIMATSRYMTWTPNARWAVLGGVAAAVSLLSLDRVSEFLYFQF
jgi:D-alanyl-lipoteichoic acid acyltransferase DltB (MBOAT superfamily)